MVQPTEAGKRTGETAMSYNASIGFVSTALDTMAGAWTRHLLIDAIPSGEGLAIVLRGEDRSRKGGESKVPPALKWNGEDGTANVFTLGNIMGEEAPALAESAIKGLRAFYAMEGKPFSERFSALIDGDYSAEQIAQLTAMALNIASAVQNGAQTHANAASHWRVGSIADTKEAKRAERAKKDSASAVATIANVGSDKAKIDQVASTIQTPEQLAALEAIVNASKARMTSAK
jgi:hypothetical protein